MAILFPDNITLNAKLPLDSRQVVENEEERLGITYAYSGLVVFEKDTQKLYVAVTNEHGVLGWKEVGEQQERIIHGYYYENNFYEDKAYEHLITPNIFSIYIDDGSEESSLYIYNKPYSQSAYRYICINPLIPEASDTVSGIAKLYNTLGQHTDGSCTQKAVTDAISEKVSVEIGTGTESECLIFIK